MIHQLGAVAEGQAYPRAENAVSDASVVGRPLEFTMTIREIRLSAGAGFLVALTGAVMTMPGLPKVPAAVKMEDQK